MDIDVSICILTHHQPELLPRAVESALVEIEKAGVRGEVIIIDNASTDGSPGATAARFPGVKVLRNEQNLGFGAANNKAIRASGGRYVLLLNDDAVLEDGSLRLLTDRLEAEPKAAAAGPKLLNPDGSLQRGFTHRAFPHVPGILAQTLLVEERLEKHAWTRSLFTMSRDPDRGGSAEHLAAACLLARREALDAVAGFDETFQYWYEDVDLCYRFKKAGWKLFYVPEALVTHFGSASLNQLALPERSAIYFASLKRYFRKNSRPWQWPILKYSLSSAVLLRACAAYIVKLFRASSTSGERRESMRRSMRVIHSLLREADRELAGTRNS